jgi:hypothetical protein
VNINLGKVPGLYPEEQAMLDDTVSVYEKKLTRNQMRVRYYEQKNIIKDLGISVPPHLTTLNTVVGWPAKAVDMLAVRSRFDGFVFKDEYDGGLLQDILYDNGFASLYAQLVTSELVHSCAFVTVTKGAEGEPAAVIAAYPATSAAALWDYRKKRIKCGLTVVEADKEDNPSWVDFFTDRFLLSIRKVGTGWTVERQEHSHGRPLIEPLVYRPTLARPLGRSRITRDVVAITDCACRQALRTEVSAEFFTTPQKYLLGAADDLFGNSTGDGEDAPAKALVASRVSKFEAYIGSIMAITNDENGERPVFGQLPQMQLQPHIEYMRLLASRFSGETGIPISSLGVIHDNPASAEAIYAAKEDLIIEAQELNASNGAALRNIALLVLATAKDLPVGALSATERSVMPKWRPVDKPSAVSLADAAIKQASAAPWIAGTSVFLEHLGFTDDEMARMAVEKRRMDAMAAFTNNSRAVADAQQKEA